MCEAGDGGTAIWHPAGSGRLKPKSGDQGIKKPYSPSRDVVDDLARERNGRYTPTGLQSMPLRNSATDPATDPSLAFRGHEDW